MPTPKLDPEVLSPFLDEATKLAELLQESLEKLTETRDQTSFKFYHQHAELLRKRSEALGLRRIEELTRVGCELSRGVQDEMDINVLLSVQSLLYQLLRATERELRLLRSGSASRSEEDNYLLTKLKVAIAALGEFGPALDLE